MQPETADPVDDQTVPPLLGRAVRAGIEQAMQDSQKRSAFEIELELAFGQCADHPLAAGLPPQSFKGQRRPSWRVGDGGGDWIGAHTRAFAAIGSVPQLLVPDNTKVAIIKAAATSRRSTEPPPRWRRITTLRCCRHGRTGHATKPKSRPRC